MKMNFETFAEHCEDNKKDFTEVKDTLKVIQENHLYHVKESVNKIENNLIEVKTDQAWLLKFFWLLAGVSITTLVTLILK
jgi:hypothetical protein